MITSLEDINQPYSCEQWGDSGAFGIPPIIDCGTSEDINPHHVFVGNNANEFPAIIAFDKIGNVIYRGSKIYEYLIQKIEDALSIEYIPNDVPLIGEQNPTSCPNLIIGCMNPNSCNYNENANYDTGVCIYPDGICDTCSAQTDGSGTVVDNDDDNDGVCNALEILGCTDNTACNYDETATDSDDCTYPEQYYNCDGTCITDTDNDGVCNALEILGCTDNTACNYDETATDSDDCTYPEQYYNCDGTCITDTDGDGVCDEIELYIVKELLPASYNINTIYPNPFNPITTISFSIPEFVLTTITVYDINGRELEILTNESLSIGYHSVNWDADNLPSGVYLIRMDSGDFTQIQKVVLIK